MKNVRLLYFTICFLFLFSLTSFAYIDPSAMTYIIQIIAGAAIAAGAAFGFYFRKLKRFFSKTFSKGDKAVDNWKYDAEDNDDFGFQDYPILECDKYLPGELTETQATLSPDAAEDSFEKYYDKFDERGIDPVVENYYLRRLLSSERAAKEEKV